MNTQDVLAKMQELIGEQFAVDAEEITMETSFEEDLGADSGGVGHGDGRRV